jgi:hypothetical protein
LGKPTHHVAKTASAESAGARAIGAWSTIAITISITAASSLTTALFITTGHSPRHFFAQVLPCSGVGRSARPAIIVICNRRAADCQGGQSSGRNR